MENQSFSPLYVAKLTINGIYALNKSTIELARPILFEIGPIPTAALNYLESMNQNLVTSMNKSQKSSFTDDMKALDKDRDLDIAEIKRVISSFLKSSNPDKKQASSTLQLFLAPYWNIASIAQDIETGVVDEMLTKYKSRPELMEAAQLLDISFLFVSLGNKNLAFDTKFKSRNTEYSERTDAASNVKPAAVAAYIQFCTSIEQAVNFTPTPTIIALFNKMDELRKKYHTKEGGGKETPTDNTSAK
jgi:hypothetical protein